MGDIPHQGHQPAAERRLTRRISANYSSSFRPVHVPPRVGRHAFSGGRGLVLRSGDRDENLDQAVSSAADPNALLKARVHLLVRLRVGDIDRVACVNEHAARAAELFPFGDERSILIDKLNAMVAAVGDQQAALRVHRDVVRRAEFDRPGAERAE